MRKSIEEIDYDKNQINQLVDEIYSEYKQIDKLSAVELIHMFKGSETTINLFKRSCSAFSRNYRLIDVNSLEKNLLKKLRLLFGDEMMFLSKIHSVFNYLNAPDGSTKQLGLIASETEKIDLIREDFKTVVKYCTVNVVLTTFNQDVKKIIRNRDTKNLTIVGFKGLFIEESMIDPCVRMLQDLIPPVVDENGVFVGKIKGVIATWYSFLNQKDVLHKEFTKPQVRQVLNNEFRNLNLSKDFSEDRKQYQNEDEWKQDFEIFFSDFSLEGKKR
jgi:hypothetical protein